MTTNQVLEKLIDELKRVSVTTGDYVRMRGRAKSLLEKIKQEKWIRFCTR